MTSTNTDAHGTHAAAGNRVDRGVRPRPTVARTCPQCGAEFFACTGRVNSAIKALAPLYCGRPCAAAARRYSADVKKALKAEYDRQRRADIGDQMKAQKRAYYEANKPRLLEKMAEYRKARMPAHVVRQHCWRTR